MHNPILSCIANNTKRTVTPTNILQILLSLFLISLLSLSLINFDQYIYFPEGKSDLVFVNNYYDDLRNEDEYIKKVSVASKFISGDYISLFVRYNIRDNPRIQSNCPDFTPLKNDGLNSNIRFKFNEGFQITGEKFEEEDKAQLLHCLSEFYEVSINDSVYAELDYYFAEHPAKNQKGIQTVISSKNFKIGENIIRIKTKYIDPSDSTAVSKDYARVPIWFSKD